MVKEMLKTGVIRANDNPYLSPIISMTKKDGS